MLDIAEFTHIAGQSQQCDRLLYQLINAKSQLLAVLCDGLNGSRAGDKAAEICSTTALQALEEGQTTEEAILTAAETLKKEQDTQKSLRTAATTICTMRVDTDLVKWATVGDSRIYHLSDDKLAHISVDDSPSYYDFLHGKIPYEDIRLQNERSQLNAALAYNFDAGKFQAHSESFTLQEGDGLLLCSDGLWSYVFEAEIVIDWLKAKTAEDWLDRLLLRCIQRTLLDGDNLSILACIYSSEAVTPRSSTEEES